MPRLDLADATLAYETAGDRGPRVLLVQGTGTLGAGWRAQVADLAADHRLAWFDNRGVGGSAPLRGEVSVERLAEDSLALLGHLGWERAHLVGHSLGGLIVQEAARRAPGRAQSLALLSTLRRGRDAFALSARALWVSLRMRIGPDAARWRAFTELGLSDRARAELGPDAAVALLRPAFCADFLASPPVVRAQLAALWRHRGGDMAALARLPCLIVTGAEDRIVPTRLSDDLAVHLPGARLARLPEAGHAVILERADAVNLLLREHLAAAEASRSAS